MNGFKASDGTIFFNNYERNNYENSYIQKSLREDNKNEIRDRYQVIKCVIIFDSVYDLWNFEQIQKEPWERIARLIRSDIETYYDIDLWPVENDENLLEYENNNQAIIEDLSDSVINRQDSDKAPIFLIQYDKTQNCLHAFSIYEIIDIANKLQYFYD